MSVKTHWWALVMAAMVAILVATLPRTAQAMFEPLPDLPGGSTVSYAAGCSADGSIAVGYGYPSGSRAMLWDASGTGYNLGVVSGEYSSEAEAVSADGTTVVGQSGSDTAFRWTAAGGMVGIGDLPGGYSWSIAYDVSATGGTAVGYSWSSNGKEAFRWTAAGGMAGLSDLAGGGFESVANACSADGSVVVGEATISTGSTAFRWVDGDGMASIGDLPGGFTSSVAYGCSADGQFVVGRSSSAAGSEAFLWSAGTDMIGLGDLPGGQYLSMALACSDDGSVVVGLGMTLDGWRPFIWDAVSGMQSLQDVLVANGDDLTGWTLTNVTDVSADGRTFVGAGTNPLGQSEAFRATIVPEPATLALVGLCGLMIVRRRG